MEKIFAIIDQMEKDGVIGRYAIGGAVGAIFWLEPISTQDIDVFVTLPSTGGGLLTLGPIYEYLTARGYESRAEYVLLEGWAVQFLPAGSPLVEEALAEAVERTLVESVRTRVFTADHLAAICLQVGRSKDQMRLEKFVTDGALDSVKFEAIVQRHGLADRWHTFQQKFFPDPS